METVYLLRCPICKSKNILQKQGSLGPYTCQNCGNVTDTPETYSEDMSDLFANFLVEENVDTAKFLDLLKEQVQVEKEEKNIEDLLGQMSVQGKKLKKPSIKRRYDPYKKSSMSSISSPCGTYEVCLAKTYEVVEELQNFIYDYVITGSFAYVLLTKDENYDVNDLDILIPLCNWKIKDGQVFLGRKPTPFYTKLSDRDYERTGFDGLPVQYELSNGETIDLDLIILRENMELPDHDQIENINVLKAKDLLKFYQDPDWEKDNTRKIRMLERHIEENPEDEKPFESQYGEIKGRKLF
tara:strand:+ start:2553 stop:3443 length:891 start_codon:yes stop_codon:yes gene_type:complete